MFRALLLTQEGKEVNCNLQELDEAALPEGDVTVDVEYSTLNYKDGLAITGSGPVVRSWPMVPGIDLAGQVRESRHPRFKQGDPVVLNGWGGGERHWGGLSQVARVNGDWLVALPDSISTRTAMAIGTAGYTAMLCVLALEKSGVGADQGEILVTGASGGVGSVAVALLAQLGYRVVAATGRMKEQDYLAALGAVEIIDRQELNEPGKPLGRERWAGAVDTLGSHTLANVLASTRYLGTVTCCGLAQGADLPATVMPFILRGVQLVGIDSVMAPLEARQEAWLRLATDLKADRLDDIAFEISMEDVPVVADQLMRGEVRGRVVVNVNQ